MHSINLRARLTLFAAVVCGLTLAYGSENESAKASVSEAGYVSHAHMFPLFLPTSIHYQVSYDGEVVDTAEVRVTPQSCDAENARDVEWTFDYHGVMDTSVIEIRGRTTDSIIGINLMPDTGWVHFDSTKMTVRQFPLLEYASLYFPSTMDVGDSWDALAGGWKYQHMASAEARVVSLDTVTVLGNSYEAYRIVIHARANEEFSHDRRIEITAYVSPGIGFVATYYTWFDLDDDGTVSEESGAWELIPD